MRECVDNKQANQRKQQQQQSRKNALFPAFFYWANFEFGHLKCVDNVATEPFDAIVNVKMHTN